MTKRYSLYTADRSGNGWTVAEYDSLDAAYLRLDMEKQTNPHQVFVIYDDEYPEAGPMQREA